MLQLKAMKPMSSSDPFWDKLFLETRGGTGELDWNEDHLPEHDSYEEED